MKKTLAFSGIYFGGVGVGHALTLSGSEQFCLGFLSFIAIFLGSVLMDP